MTVRSDDDARLDAWLAALPKAEMHLHFEGAFRWRTVRELHPWGPALPSTPPWLLRERPFRNFDDFRQTFRDYIRPVSGTPETLERHAFEVIEDLARQNVRYAEIIVSHDLHAVHGLPDARIWQAIAAGRDRATARYPIDARLFLGLNRHAGPDHVRAVFDSVTGVARGRDWLAGIDLQGDERQGETATFAAVLRDAAAAGLKVRVHAGELNGPDAVRATVFDHGVRQISHGVRAAEDPALLRELATAGVFLHVCPTSNLLLGCAPSYREHPLRSLVDAGVRCTVNSDDPLLFATDIVQEYRTLVREMGFTPADVAEFARNGFRASLLPADRVQAACADIDNGGLPAWP